jgi:hypothetical protein
MTFLSLADELLRDELDGRREPWATTRKVQFIFRQCIGTKAAHRYRRKRKNGGTRLENRQPVEGTRTGQSQECLSTQSGKVVVAIGN